MTIVGMLPHTRTRSVSINRSTSAGSNLPSRKTSRPPDSSVLQLTWMPARWNSGTDSMLTVPGWVSDSSSGSRPVRTSRLWMLATTARWDMSTPLGAPVVPELNMMIASASSSGGASVEGFLVRHPIDRLAQSGHRQGGTPLLAVGDHQRGIGLVEGGADLVVAPPGVAEDGGAADRLHRPEADDPFDGVEADEGHPVSRAHAMLPQDRSHPGDRPLVLRRGEPALALDEQFAVGPAPRGEQELADRVRPVGVEPAGMPVDHALGDLPAPVRCRERGRVTHR